MKIEDYIASLTEAEQQRLRQIGKETKYVKLTIDPRLIDQAQRSVEAKILKFVDQQRAPEAGSKAVKGKRERPKLEG